MVKVPFEFAMKRINHSTFCMSIIETFKTRAEEYQRQGKKLFKEIFTEKIVIFKQIVSEFMRFNDSIHNIFEFINIIIDSLEEEWDFETSRQWFIQRLDDLVKEKFLNSQIVLLENVF